MENKTIKLTAREVEYIELVAAGKTNTFIANNWVRAGETARTHRQNIRAKFGVTSFYAVLTLAHQQGSINLSTIKVTR